MSKPREFWITINEYGEPSHIALHERFEDRETIHVREVLPTASHTEPMLKLRPEPKPGEYCTVRYCEFDKKTNQVCDICQGVDPENPGKDVVPNANLTTGPAVQMRAEEYTATIYAENKALKEKLRVAIDALEEITKDVYELNPWTVQKSNTALIAEKALERFRDRR